MPLFVCRWENGDFSAVSAPSREAAIELLDEVGNAEDCEVFVVKDFMVHFQLEKKVEALHGSVPVLLEGFGEKTQEMLLERVYPIYDKLFSEAMEGLDDEASTGKAEAGRKAVNDALTTERNRLWGAKERKLSGDADVAKLQEAGDLPKISAERVVKEHRRRRILETPPSTNKVQ
jgi:hypothetical protein